MNPIPMLAHKRHHLSGPLASTRIWLQQHLSVEDVADAPHWLALTAQSTWRRRLRRYSSLGESLSACLKCLHFHCCARECLTETLGATLVCVGRRLKDCFSAVEPRPTCHNSSSQIRRRNKAAHSLRIEIVRVGEHGAG
jgi:phage terminase small subunit